MAGAATFGFDALGRTRARTVAGTVDTYSFIGDTETVVRISTKVGTGNPSLVDSLVGSDQSRLGTLAGSLFGLLIPDLHGNVAAAANANLSSTTDALRYDAWGNVIATVTSALPTPWRYQGRMLVDPTGASDLYDAGARYYSPGLGTFTGFDTVSGSAQNPISMNRYLYAAADPTTLVDPDGHRAINCGPDGIKCGYLGTFVPTPHESAWVAKHIVADASDIPASEAGIAAATRRLKLAQDNSGDWTDPANWPTKAQWDAMSITEKHAFAASMGIYAYTFMRDHPDRSITNPAVLDIGRMWWVDEEAAASSAFYASCGSNCPADKNPVQASTAIMTAAWFYSYDQLTSQYEAAMEAGDWGTAFIYGTLLTGYVGMSDPGFHLNSKGGAGGRGETTGSAPEGSILAGVEGEADALGGCSFAAGTLVVASAALVAISALHVGDQVMAYDPRTGETSPHTVIAVMVDTDPAVEHLTTDKGSIETTPNHPFFTTDRGWMEAGFLQVGEQIRTESGAPATVLSFTVDQHPASMWDLTVDGAHSFFVGSGAMLVHNCPWGGGEPANPTGRWYPLDKGEESALDSVFDSPFGGDQIMKPGEFDDPAYNGMTVEKFSRDFPGYQIHWVVEKSGAILDWKFVFPGGH